MSWIGALRSALHSDRRPYATKALYPALFLLCPRGSILFLLCPRCSILLRSYSEYSPQQNQARAFRPILPPLVFSFVVPSSCDNVRVQYACHELSGSSEFLWFVDHERPQNVVLLCETAFYDRGTPIPIQYILNDAVP